MGFEEKWCKWVEICLRSASMSILVNGSPSEEFGLKRGVRQGDPLSPFLFILAAEGLNAIVTKAVEKGIFRGVVVRENKITVSHLQYADNTIFFGEWNKENAKLLCAFANASKRDGGVWHQGIPVYVGLPIGENMRRVNAWGPVVENSKVGCNWWWRFRREGSSLWVMVIKSIYGTSGGLGDRRDMRGGRSGGGVWNDIVRIGEEINGVGLDFSSLCVGVLGDEKDIRFWVDKWVDNRMCCDRFPRLYHLDRRKEGSVWDKGSWVNGVWCWEWEWVRNIRGRVTRDLDELLGLVQNVVVHSNCRDKWRWLLCVKTESSRLKRPSNIGGEKKMSCTVEIEGMGHFGIGLVLRNFNIFVWWR
ncbi:reverse transcriptase domain, reverse transcriptase zinc-binding domain protein [Tanacetum coccineum]